MAGDTMIESSLKGHSTRKAVPLDLRSPGLFARRPIIGWLLLIVGILFLAGFTYNLKANGPLLNWDNTLAHNLPAIGLNSPPFVKYLMNAGFFLGKEVVSVLVFVHVLYFVIKRYWQELTMLLVGVIGSSMAFYVLSHIIGRQRPDTQIWILVNIPGFPSGHATTVVAFYGLLAYLLVPKIPSAFWKGMVIVITLLIIGFVGFSRIFTAGHYLTDILAGYALGIAWCGLMFTLIERYFQWRGGKHA